MNLEAPRVGSDWSPLPLVMSLARWPRARSADLQSISTCPNRRRPRRFCGARLCEPQHVDCDRRAGIVKTLGGRQSSCGSQTRAPLVPAWPRCAVSQVFNLPHAACEQRSADYKSAIRQIKNLRYGKQIPRQTGEGQGRFVGSTPPAGTRFCTNP